MTNNFLIKKKGRKASVMHKPTIFMRQKVYLQTGWRKILSNNYVTALNVSCDLINSIHGWSYESTHSGLEEILPNQFGGKLCP